MLNILYDFIFLIISVYVLLKTIGYAIYEIKELKNKTGGIIIISLSIFTVILSNIIVFLK